MVNERFDFCIQLSKRIVQLNKAHIQLKNTFDVEICI